jgi:hypothetical protein
MTVSTCPYPGNINPLYLTGYQFVINKLPELTYFVQETEIPGLSLGQSQVGNPLIASKIPGDTMEFSELQLQFIIDEDLKNWNAIYFWITGLGFPQNHEMYRRYMRASINKNLYSESSKGVSDGTLTLLDNSQNIKQIFTFVDMFPINLSGLRLDSSITDATPAVGTVTFAYTYYSINKDVE